MRQKLYGPNGSRRNKRRWQEYTEELLKKDHDPDNRNGVVTPPTARHPGV